MSKAQWIMKTKVGPIYLVASENGLCEAMWQKRSDAPVAKSLDGDALEIRHLANAVRQLEEYFSGKRREFDIPMDVEGTEFQKKVWKQLRRIPYGKTCSYSDIAKRIGQETAVRAVGTANGRNPISIVVPCHRVIQANGTLGGYAGGLNAKTKLLEMELGKAPERT